MFASAAAGVIECLKSRGQFGVVAERRLADLMELLAVGIAIGVVPLLIGFLPRIAFPIHRKPWIQFAAGTALGFMTVFFNDLIDDSGGLGESLGLSMSFTQISLAALFVLGFGVFMMWSRDRSAGPPLIAYLVAIAIGLHALGEGIVIGSNFVGQVEIEELSTVYQGLSFALHKFLEGFTISIFFTSRLRSKMILVSVLLAGIPLLMGIPLGVLAYPAILANFLFAAGAGAAVFVIVKIALMIGENRPDIKTVLGFMVGFVAVYFAALIHFTILP